MAQGVFPTRVEICGVVAAAGNGLVDTVMPEI